MSASELRRAALAAGLLALAGCNPQSVNLRELSPVEYSVAVNAKAMESCVPEARKRAEREAKSYCGAHGRELRAGPMDRQGSSETGCRVELIFSCGLPRQ